MGAGNLIEPLLIVEDGKYLFLDGAAGSASLVTNINYDGLMPPAASIETMTYATRHARNFSGGGAVVSGNIVFAALPLPVPTSIVTTSEPQEADWVEGDVVFNSTTSSTLPMVVSTFVERLGLYPGDGAFGFNWAPDSKMWMDFFELTIEFSLPLPTIPSGPSFFSTTRNSTELSNTLSAAAGISNSTYPLTVRTRYTQADPGSRAAQDEGIGQGQIFETDPQTVFSDDATARNISIIDSITGLSPNTTYYAQTRCENADGDIVDSDWTSFTTRQFDTVLSF